MRYARRCARPASMSGAAQVAMRPPPAEVAVEVEAAVEVAVGVGVGVEVGVGVGVAACGRWRKRRSGRSVLRRQRLTLARTEEGARTDDCGLATPLHCKVAPAPRYG